MASSLLSIMREKHLHRLDPLILEESQLGLLMPPPSSLRPHYSYDWRFHVLVLSVLRLVLD